MNSHREERHPHVIAIVDKIKSEGIFDALRKDCLADVDVKPAYQNLKQKVESACATFLSRIIWSDKLNKNQLREQMRKNLEDSGVLQAGVKRIVHQVVTPKIDLEVKPKVAQVVCEYLGVDPDEIHTEDDDGEENTFKSAPQSNIGLYPYNPLQSDAPVTAPIAPPGFEDSGKVPETKKEAVSIEEKAEPKLEESKCKKEEKANKNEDMDISEKSDSRSTSRASTKKSIDMDCTMTSDEEEGAAVNGADLSKGLAAYMAASPTVARNDDDMSISSSDTSSKRGQVTPEPTEDVKATTTNTTGGRKRGRGDADGPPVERREMRRQRTRNKKYMSDDFESIFTENKELLGEAYSQEVFEEEIITTDEMVSQVVFNEPVNIVTTKESQTKESQPTKDTQPSTSSSSSKKEKSAPASYNLRRSSRNRGGQTAPLEETSTTQQQSDQLTGKSEENSKSITAPIVRRNLRSQKSLSGEQLQSPPSGNASTITPRRYTRSSAKQSLNKATSDDETSKKSSGSTPTQDEAESCNPSFTIVDSLVVLSDICNTVIDSHSNQSDVSNSNDSTPVKDEPSHSAPDKSTSVTSESPVLEKPEIISTAEARQSPSLLVESYEPELHFDEMSRDMTESAGFVRSRTSNATPISEPASPDRITESPTSPPSSPVTECQPQASASMVTIPLEGEGSIRSAPEPKEAMSGSTTADAIPMPMDTLPPLPPELPPLPASPHEERAALPPPEPEGDEEEEVVYHVLSEVGADDTSSLAEHGEGEASEQVCSAEEEVYEGRSAAEEDDYDLEELERLAQRKMEILKAIELPDSVLEKPVKEPSSEEEEGEITDSSGEERSKAKKKKSKKSKKKKSKKEKRKYHDFDDFEVSSSKRSRYY